MGKLAYQLHETIATAQAGDYILGKYIDKFGEDLYLELEQAQIDEVLGAVEEGVVTGEVDGVDSSDQTQVGEAVPEVLSNGGEEE